MSKDEAASTPAASTPAAATITPEEAQRIVEAERARNLRACEAEIQTVLQRWGCRLVAVPYLEDGLTRATVQIRVA